jgi:hypothetical protein
MRVRDIIFAVKFGVALPGVANAHVSEQGFVLLLPTGAWSAAGLAVVVLTVLALALTPQRAARAMFRPRVFCAPEAETLRTATSLLSTMVLGALVIIGLDGPRNPLSNLMPLTLWTVFWIGLVSIAGVAGDLWRWINPWTGLYRLIGPARPALNLPERLGGWPAVVIVTGFFAFLLADIAPDDPARLAYLIGGYWLLTTAALIVFGEAWMRQGEAASVLFAQYGDLSAQAGIGAPCRPPIWGLVDAASGKSLCRLWSCPSSLRFGSRGEARRNPLPVGPQWCGQDNHDAGHYGAL